MQMLGNLGATRNLYFRLYFLTPRSKNVPAPPYASVLSLHAGSVLVVRAFALELVDQVSIAWPFSI